MDRNEVFQEGLKNVDVYLDMLREELKEYRYVVKELRLHVEEIKELLQASEQ
jgi:signal transduction histidine kinase